MWSLTLGGIWFGLPINNKSCFNKEFIDFNNGWQYVVDLFGIEILVGVGRFPKSLGALKHFGHTGKIAVAFPEDLHAGCGIMFPVEIAAHPCEDMNGGAEIGWMREISVGGEVIDDDPFRFREQHRGFQARCFSSECCQGGEALGHDGGPFSKRRGRSGTGRLTASWRWTMRTWVCWVWRCWQGRGFPASDEGWHS